MQALQFTKMHGTGNDFVIIDFRSVLPVPIDYKKVADRRCGIGCDQVVLLKNSDIADCQMVIYNTDSSSAEVCGNATRCVAAMLMAKNKNKEVVIESSGRVLECFQVEDGKIRVNMGPPKLDWYEIPLSDKCDTNFIPITVTARSGLLHSPVGVNIGNPHAVFFVKSLQKISVQNLGSQLEKHPIFPQRANIGFAEVVSDNEINLRVWERGSGETQSCGSGACAALVAAVRRGYTKTSATIRLPGGELLIEWDKDDNIFMTGDAVYVFTGCYNSD